MEEFFVFPGGGVFREILFVLAEVMEHFPKAHHLLVMENLEDRCDIGEGPLGQELKLHVEFLELSLDRF